MALPLILGLLGSSLGAGTALGAVGAGALASGVGRFLETGDLEEGLKTGATSLIGGKVLGSFFGGAGDAGTKLSSAANTGTPLFQQSGFDPSKLTPDLSKFSGTFGQRLAATASDPVALGQATLAQATVPPPTPRKPDPVEFENRQAGIPRNVYRRPPPDYRPGYDGEFDYGITPNYGVGVMSPNDPMYMNMGGLVGLLGNEKVQNALSNVAGIALNPAMQREANNLMTGEFTPEGYSPLTMADVGMNEGGSVETPAMSEELQEIIVNAARALQGATDEPERDINRFVETFGVQALNDLRERVASGEMSMGKDGGLRGMISGEGDGMSDSIEAEIVENVGDDAGTGRPLQVANNEYVVAADVVSDIGNGSSEAGAKKLDDLMKKVRLARHGTTQQPKEKNMMSVMKEAIT
jgi:hypothetical protein